MDYIDIVFDGPPNPEGARFVEVEDSRGKSINFGEWCSGQMDIGRFAFLRMHGSLDGKVMLEDELQPWGRDERIPRRRKHLIHGGYRFLASRGNRALLPAFNLLEIVGPADQRAGSPAADQWRSGAMPGLRSAACSSGWHGRGFAFVCAHCGKGVELPRPKPM